MCGLSVYIHELFIVHVECTVIVCLYYAYESEGMPAYIRIHLPVCAHVFMCLYIYLFICELIDSY